MLHFDFLRIREACSSYSMSLFEVLRLGHLRLYPLLFLLSNKRALPTLLLPNNTGWALSPASYYQTSSNAASVNRVEMCF
jgi:hypothetical protein